MTALDREIFARQALGLTGTVEIRLSSLGKRGSDRQYFRIERQGEKSAILVEYDPGRAENGYFVDIARFLQRIDVPVPNIIRHDPEAHLILMEDLGDTDLFSLRQQPWENRGPIYRETVVIVNRLHSFPIYGIEGQALRLMEPFGPALYQWERNYFLEHFVKGLCEIHLPSTELSDLEGELSSLAERLCESRMCLVHRDLQSQNIMVSDGRPVLIDFQGMRYGSRFYDLGSLLYDPYVDLTDEERDELLDHYYEQATRDIRRQEFRGRFWEASAQRLMQALGAYGFLGKTKGLPGYLHHVPAALRHLLAVTEHAASLALLRRVATACSNRMEKCPSF